MPEQTSLLTADLDYPLPPGLVATRPVEPRDSARLLVMRRGGDGLEHAHVYDLPDLLAATDTLVFNTTSVAPARLLGRRAGTGGRIEGLFVEDAGPGRWVVMLRSNGRLHPGDRVELEPDGEIVLELVEPHEQGWVAALSVSGPTAHVLDHVGRTPLPPYILRARGDETVPDELDRRWYQTVYADPGRFGSVAAPTAGLHFTPELLDRLRERGVGRLDVTLHVGPGTFRPITEVTLAAHRMHAENCEVPAATVAGLASARRRGSRIIAVGTTSVRTLESLPLALLPGEGFQGSTDLMIAPPYSPRHVDGLMTNFHLPRSTLLALVAALVGLERLKAAYAEAVARGYRFYSYGDAMLILP